MRPAWIGIAWLAGLFAAAAIAQGAPDGAPDPFRSLEDATRAETQAFLREQDAKASATLASIPGRAAMLDRIRELSRSGIVASDLKLEGGKFFYLRRRPGEAASSLCVRDAITSAERVLVDPQRAGGEGGAIDWYAPSPDAKHVAYGISRPGTEDSTLRIVAVEGARDLGVAIDRTRFNARLAWHPDGHAFYYARAPQAGGARRDANIRVYRHVLGRQEAQDEIVFAPGVGGARDVPEFAYPSLVVPQESQYAYAIAREGFGNEIAVHVTTQKDLAAARPRWRKVIAPQDEVTAIEAWKNDLYALSHRGAPRFRVLRLDAADPVVARAKVVVPEGDTAIQSMALARDALYLRTTVGGLDRLERVPLGLLGPRTPEYVKTPFEVGISQVVTHPRRPGAFLVVQGWIEPPALLEVDAKTGNLRDMKLQAPMRADFSAMDEVRLYATADDGTKIPVTLLYRKTTQLTGENPTIVSGYGAYGESMRPVFDPARLAWLERGGVYAIAHVRGGGEYGEAWHAAGRRARKATAIRDFIAVADFLVKYGFTNPRKLAIEATGAGGVLVGNALVRRPDLFAAVVARVPFMDLLRFEAMPEGPASVPEFGSAATREGMEALLAISPYHQVKEGTPYPAVLLTAGIGNAHVEPWQPAKMAARLQQATASGKPVLLQVDFASGLGHGTTRARLDEELADAYSFALWQFGDAAFQPRPANETR